MCKLCWTLLVGALVAFIVAILMIAPGNETGTAPDGREVILLKPHQRDLVLTEMRTFVESLRDINQALGNDDTELFQEASLKVGLKAQKGVPLDMMKALPLPFKKLGMSTHKQFDELAESAEQGADTRQLLTGLSQLMNNCVACHAAYQLQSSEPMEKD
jgi:hypothetical protein